MRGPQTDQATPCLDLSGAFLACLAATCERLQIDRGLVLGIVPGQQPHGCIATEEQRLATLSRQIAIYALNCEVGVPQYQCAAAVGLSRAGVLYIVRFIEDLREEPIVDALIDEIGASVLEAIDEQSPYR